MASTDNIKASQNKGGKYMMNEYKVYIVGNKNNIDIILRQAQDNELIEAYQIEDT